MLLPLALLVISVAVLAKSAVYVIERLTEIAIKLRVSEYLVGFLVMAIATSLPELVIGIVSSIGGDNTISLGNVLGANIADLTLVIGLGVLIGGAIRVQTQIRNQEVYLAGLIGLIPLMMLLDHQLTRGEGVILLLLFGFHTYNIVVHSKEYHRVTKDHRTVRPLGQELLLFGIGLILLLVSADVAVRAGTKLATLLEIPTILVGVLLGLGTTLPELSTSIVAVSRKQGSLVTGNVLGSIATNSALVLGVAALIHPITLNGEAVFKVSAVALFLALALLVKFIRSQYRVDRLEAVILILAYVLYLAATELFR